MGFGYTKYLPTHIPEDGNASDLPVLEEAFHVCDLLYGYMDRFEHPEGIPEVLAVKEKLSLAIMKILEKQELTGRRCRECGRPLPWNYPFGVCERCHHGRGHGRGRRKRYARLWHGPGGRKPVMVYLCRRPARARTFSDDLIWTQGAADRAFRIICPGRLPRPV